MPFEVPQGWAWSRLGEIFTLQAGKNITAKAIYAKKDTDHCYPCYGGNGLRGYVSSYNIEGHFPLIGRQGALCGNINEANGRFYATEHAVIVNTYCDTNIDWAINVLVYLNLNHYATSTAQPGLSVGTINEVVIPIPPLEEQQRISQKLNDWFCLIDQIEQGKSDLQTTIKQTKSKILDLAIHGRLVPQNPEDEPASELLKRINPKAEITCDNAHYPQLPEGWIICHLEDVIEYEQPTAYTVSSTNYSDSYPTPVLTAGKSFIIGYTDETAGVYNQLPCIIFDDFTTDSKYVDFPFKVKSSAMKILRVHEDLNIEYVSFFMSVTRLIGDTHKRYWISEYSKLSIPLPPKNEQDRIVDSIKSLYGLLDTINESL